MTAITGAPAGSDSSREPSEQFRLLYESALAFADAGDLDALQRAVLEQFRTLVQADDAALWVAEGGELQCRLTTGAEGEPGLAVPLEADGTVIARVDLWPGADRAPFTAADRSATARLAALAAPVLRTALARSRDSRAADLRLLLEISSEITATLDIDRVLRSVVNLSARALTFDRAAVGLYDKGVCEIRAIAGQQTIDPKDPKVLDLAARAAWLAGNGESFYMVDREDPASDAERQLVQIFGQDLEADGARSGLYLPLKDEEGTVGILLFESSEPEFASESQREIAAILANQTAVALRNAQLYAQVPLVDALGAIGAKKRAFMELPKRRRQAYAAVVLLALAALTLIRWPLRVSGLEPSFRPLALTPVRARVPGVVERVLVQEGAAVAQGDPLVQLRDVDLRSARAATLAAIAAADRSAALAASRGDAAEERAQRMRGETLREEAALLDEELAAASVRAPLAGVVLTARPEERVGTYLDAGDLVLTLGRTDSLELEFGIDQREIGRVAIGQPVRLRVDALPQRTFRGTVTSLGPVPADSADHVSFPVRAVFANPDGLLRPGMRGYARVLTAPASVATRIVRAPIRWARLLWWRTWS